jgi:hypothetical protein
MNGYENGKIYKVVDENGDIIYIGSTKLTLKARWDKPHHLKCDEYNIVLIENYSCESRKELCKVEQKFIDLYNEMGLINKNKAYQTKQERKQQIKEYAQSDKYKEYSQSEKRKESQKKYQKSDKSKETKKKYQQSDKYKEYQKKYNQSEKRKEQQKIKANCPNCNKLMLKESILRHIKTACKKI